MSEEQLARIEGKIERVIATQAEHGMTLGQHTAKLDRLDRRVTAVEVTLETTVPHSIKQIAEGHSVLQGSIDRGFAEVMARLDEHVQPIEAASRYLASQVPAPKRRRK